MFNSVANVVVNLSSTILSFVVRTFFINTLGKELLGLDGLFTNILSLLSLAELGFSTAISFSLYEPLAKNNTKKTSQIVFYLKCIYRRIFLFILLAGLCVIPFLQLIVKDYPVDSTIYIIYILYLLNTAFSYLLSYSGVLIEADQKNYKLTPIRICFDLCTYLAQLMVLIVYKNFIMYLVMQLLIRFIQRLYTNYYIQKQYLNINFNETSSLEDEEKNKIKRNIKGIIFHRVGDYAVNSTDNILISSIVSISTTGIYSNYLAITSIFRNLMSTVMSATTSSLGNLNVTENAEIKHNVFKNLNFLAYFLSGFLVVGVYFCINPFISLWVGESYLVSKTTTAVICINLYLACLLFPIDAVKNSTGLYYIDRYIPILQAFINLTISTILGRKVGLLGILLGTTISTLLTVSITKPYVVYKNVFHISCKEYYLKTLKNIFIIFSACIISTFILNNIGLENAWVSFFMKGIISIIVYVLLFFLFHFYTKEFHYYKEMIMRKKVNE